MDPDHLSKSPLGRKSEYSGEYDPRLLCPLPRRPTWVDYGYARAPYYGVDIWNAYELSWLNENGLPQVAIGEFRVPFDSPAIIESKSFKLYLNSFNQSRFKDVSAICEILKSDLSACAGATVEPGLRNVDTLQGDSHMPGGQCLDELDVRIEAYSRDAGILRSLDGSEVHEKLYSHILKTNCPVTGQPDWGSVFIEYRGKPIAHDSLLKYIVSYRSQRDFHEQCIENIFLDILQKCQPAELCVYGRYLRRGGLDINPYRDTRKRAPENFRLIRQ